MLNQMGVAVHAGKPQTTKNNGENRRTVDRVFLHAHFATRDEVHMILVIFCSA